MRAEQLNKPRIAAQSVRVPGVAPRWVLPTVQVALVLTDALVAVGAFLLAYHLREGHAIVLRWGAGNWAWRSDFSPYAAVSLFVLPVRLLAHVYYGLYRSRGEFFCVVAL